MPDIVVRKGYDLKLVGKPASRVEPSGVARIVGVRPPEFHGVKLSVRVEVGQAVRAGTPLLCDKENSELQIVAPAGGTVREIKRGARRFLQEILIDVAESEAEEDFGTLDPNAADAREITALLLRAGVWPWIRQHPFGRIADPHKPPKAVFLSAARSEPFEPDPNIVLDGQADAFQVGITALAKLTPGDVHLTLRRDDRQPCPALVQVKGVQKHTVTGPHPAGNPAVHAFYIDRVKPAETVWVVGIQEVAAIGALCLTGRFPTRRVVALAGGGVRPECRGHYQTRVGAQIESIVDGRLADDNPRIISGSVLNGTKVAPGNSLGFYDSAVCAIPEGDDRRELLGWLWPGRNKYSRSRTFLSSLSAADREFEVDTNLNGGIRACIQSGFCQEVCPVEMQPLFVWKACSYGDLEEAEQFGILDCVGCGLCTYVCPSKIEIDAIIKKGLELIEKEVLSS